MTRRKETLVSVGHHGSEDVSASKHSRAADEFLPGGAV